MHPSTWSNILCYRHIQNIDKPNEDIESIKKENENLKKEINILRKEKEDLIRNLLECTTNYLKKCRVSLVPSDR